MLYTIEYYSAIKRNKFVSVLVRWMNLEFVIQSELSQKEKKQVSFIIWNIQKWSPREENGNPLQYSCLENPVDKGAWWASPWGHRRVRQNLPTKQQQKKGTKEPICRAIIEKQT